MVSTIQKLGSEAEGESGSGERIKPPDAVSIGALQLAHNLGGGRMHQLLSPMSYLSPGYTVLNGACDPAMLAAL